MLIPQQPKCEMGQWQGSHRVSLTQVRRQLASPSEMQDGHRQRLLELARRLARVKALGDEYSRVDLSDAAALAVGAEATA